MSTTSLGPCLELNVGHDSYGYAMLYRDGKSVRAHRQAWIDAHGPIPRTTLVCHRCDNPRCSRLSHLFIGSHKDNSADMARKGRAPWAGKTMPAEARARMSAAKKGIAKTAAQNEANRQAQIRRWALRKSAPTNPTPGAAIAA